MFYICQSKMFGKVVHVAGPYFNKKTKKPQVIVYNNNYNYEKVNFNNNFIK